MTTPERPIPVSISRPDGDDARGEEPARPSREGGPESPPSPAPSQGRPGFVLTPPIDIFENAEGMILLADLPGVTEGSVSIELEDNVLSLRAEARSPVPESASPLLEESPIGSYQRTFILSGEVDRARISAELKQGVLRLILPKVERARPRRIEIKGLDGAGPSP